MKNRSFVLSLALLAAFAWFASLPPVAGAEGGKAACNVSMKDDNEEFVKMNDEDNDKLKVGDMKVKDKNVSFKFRQDNCPVAVVVADWCDGKSDELADIKEGEYKNASHAYAEGGEYFVEVRVYCKNVLETRDSDVVLVR